MADWAPNTEKGFAVWEYWRSAALSCPVAEDGIPTSESLVNVKTDCFWAAVATATNKVPGHKTSYMCGQRNKNTHCGIA